MSHSVQVHTTTAELLSILKDWKVPAVRGSHEIYPLLWNHSWSEVAKVCAEQVERCWEAKTLAKSYRTFEFYYRAWLEALYQESRQEELESLISHFRALQQEDTPHLELWHGLEALTHCFLDDVEACDLLLATYVTQPLTATLLETQLRLWLQRGAKETDAHPALCLERVQTYADHPYFLLLAITQFFYAANSEHLHAVTDIWQQKYPQAQMQATICLQRYLDGADNASEALNAAKTLRTAFPQSEHYATWFLLLQSRTSEGLSVEQRQSGVLKARPLLHKIVEDSVEELSSSVASMPRAPRCWLTFVSQTTIEYVGRHSYRQQVSLPMGKDCKKGDVIFCAARFPQMAGEMKNIRILSCYQAISDAEWDEEMDFLSLAEARAIFEHPVHLDIDFSNIQDRRKTLRKGDPMATGSFMLTPQALQYVRQGITAQNENQTYDKLLSRLVANS
ncbi:MAG: hypothetical protein OXT67_03745 [Zetaproteobacteria bacterium]|nr:hypothetical protein [Zetaproteobacteria bacterium]